MRKRGGFTLIELLVVIGIIVALVAILLPTIRRAYLVAEKSAIASDLAVIGNGLDAYRNDFGSYPKPGGANMLCWALVAPGPAAEDGADGPGFRLRGTTGRVYGPYLPPDRFVVGIMGGNPGDMAGVISLAGAGKPPSDRADVLADRLGRVILYYPENTVAHPSNVPASYVGPNGKGLWDPNDGGAGMWDYCLRNLLGAAPDGSLLPGTTPVTAPYLLISAGTADPVAQVTDPTFSSPQSQGSGVPDPFGEADNVANVPLTPRFPIPIPHRN